jgi:nicotinamide-nucleotide adenylyltransferase
MRALFVGRFQPFHKGHLRVIKDILKENDFVVIAIGSSQEKGTEKNPFSFEERKKMIEIALKNEGIENFKIIAVPDVFDDKKWVSLIKKQADFDVVYSRNPWTIRCFRDAGITVKKHRLYKKSELSGTNIRKNMKKGRPWKHFVPKAVFNFLRKLKRE